MPPQSSSDDFSQYKVSPSGGGDWDQFKISDPTDALSKASTLKAAPKPGSAEWFKEYAFRGGSAAANLAPAAGGTVGGIAGSSGGPAGSIGGAALGGGAGEAAKQLLLRMLGYPSPKTSREAATGIAEQGALQGGLQGLTEGLPLAAPGLSRAAETQYGKALGPTTRQMKNITQDIVPGLIQRGERGSLQTLAARGEEHASDLGPQLDAAYARTPATATAGSGSTIMQDLDALKNQYTVAGKVANPTAVKAIEGVQDIVKQYGPDIDPDSLRKLKRIFDDPVASRGGYAGADLSTAYTLRAQKAAANSIRKIMGQANPDVAALNKEISFWLDVQSVTSASILRKTGQSGGLAKVLTPLAAGASGAITGSAAGAAKGVEAGVGTTLTILAYQAIKSPAWNTASAVFKDRFAQQLAKGNVGEALALLGRLSAAAPGVTKSLSQPSPRSAQ